MVFTFRYTISSTTNREGCGCLVKGHPLALADEVIELRPLVMVEFALAVV